MSLGFDLVMPPMIEFLDALLTGADHELDLQTFKLTDQISGRLLGVRADMTPQVARIDAHYLRREGPARLCYCGSVLRTRPDEFAGPRELIQVGAEIYGLAGPEADIEVIDLMLAAMAAIGLKDLYLDLSHTGVGRALAQEADLDASQTSRIFSALACKRAQEAADLLATWQISKSARDRLLALSELDGGPEVLTAARKRLAGSSAETLDALAELDGIVAEIHKRHPGTRIVCDLGELGGYQYYTGARYALYQSGQGKPLAQGGRYDGIGRAFGRNRPATGFSADLRRLARLAPM
jgi:ATP phosphoribosyltransferase regulatory subunit